MEPVICKAQGTGFERMGKRAVPVVYFEFEGSNGWAVTYEEKNTHIIEEGDFLYVWHNNKKKRLYLAIYAGECGVKRDKNPLIYVYCRSGNRSRQAAEKLVGLGYTNIVEIGGILDWTGEIIK